MFFDTSHGARLFTLRTAELQGYENPWRSECLSTPFEFLRRVK
jgi:hypothetical protein